jgi:endonuclease-3
MPTARRRPLPGQPPSQAEQVVAGLARHYPGAFCALQHRNAYELLVATILSAQCTDARVNLVTPALFVRYPNAPALATAEPAELENLIRSTGFFRAKAKNLIGMAQGLVARHGGEVPTDLDALTALPGVGRKTAHVVLGTAFGIPSGVVVDTHVKRLAFRLGLTRQRDPGKVELDLARQVPPGEWIDLSHRLIAHGRAICQARKPACEACPLSPICPRKGLATRNRPAASREAPKRRRGESPGEA